MALPDFISIIREKNDRIEAIPAAFLSSVKKSEKEIYGKIIELLGQLDQKGGQFVASVKNLNIAAQINEQLKLVLVESEFANAVGKFASEFDVQAEVNMKYFSEAFSLQTVPEVATALVVNAKRNAVDLLLNRAADSEFIYPLRDIIEQSVVNNANYLDTLRAIREFVEGTDDRDSRLLRYSTQIARDSFAIADASYTSIVSDELESEWFYYSGGLIDTSRAFCKERADQYFYYVEVEKWGDGIKTKGFQLPDADGGWAGEILGTTAANIWSYRAGYNCGHSFMPVSIFSVPLDVIQRNIDQGFFTPTDKERELLGL